MASASQDIFDLFLRRRTVLSPLRYPGGKRRLAPYVAATLAENDLRPNLFVEPYAGGASVALELLHFDLVDKVVLGDQDALITSFWQTVVSDVDWLCEQVERVSLDLAMWERMKVGRFRSRRSMALACLYLNRTSFNGSLHPSAGPIGGKAQVNWWAPNINALMGLIGAAGFNDAEVLAGEPTDDERPGDGPHHYRAIIRAVK